MARRPHPTILCPIHHVELICPIENASKGGKATAKKHGRAQLSRWGKLGGRPAKKKKSKPR